LKVILNVSVDVLMLADAGAGPVCRVCRVRSAPRLIARAFISPGVAYSEFNHHLAGVFVLLVRLKLLVYTE